MVTSSSYQVWFSDLENQFCINVAIKIQDITSMSCHYGDLKPCTRVIDSIANVRNLKKNNKVMYFGGIQTCMVI